MAAKLSSRLGRNKVIVVEPADVRKQISQYSDESNRTQARCVRP